MSSSNLRRFGVLIVAAAFMGTPLGDARAQGGQGFDFGWQPTNHAGGAAAGEGGGTIRRGDPNFRSYYADTDLGGILTLDQPINATGKIDWENFQNFDGDHFFGFFNTEEYGLGGTNSPNNVLGLHAREPGGGFTGQRIFAALFDAVQDYPTNYTATPTNGFDEPRDRNFDFIFDYNPLIGDGELLVDLLENGTSVLEGGPLIYALTPEERQNGAQFNAFGLRMAENNTDRSERVDFFFDDLEYTVFGGGTETQTFDTAESAAAAGWTALNNIDPIPNAIQPPVFTTQDPLPGPRGGEGFVGLREVRGFKDPDPTSDANRVASINEAIEILSGPLPATATVTETASEVSGEPVINHFDPDTGHDGAHAAHNPQPFIGNLPDTDDQGVLAIYHGKIEVPAGQGGEWTFDVRSNDGFALRFPGQNFTQAFGEGAIAGDETTQDTVATSGTGSTRGIINLPAGVHDVEFIAYANAGDNFWEVAAGKGSFPDVSAEDAMQHFRPLGYRAPPSVEPVGEIVGGAFNVKEVHVAGEEVTDLTTALNLINTPIPEDRIVEYTSPTINFNDPENPGGHGLFGSFTRSPFEGGEAGVDDNDFILQAMATLQIPESQAGPISFGVHTDDGFQLEIRRPGGQVVPFTDSVPNNSLDETGYVTPQGFLAYEPTTGDSNTIGHIDLAAGNYELIFTMFERGGGAFAELSAALGFQPSFNGNFVLLGGVPFPDFDGLQFVGNVALLAGDANGDGTVDLADFLILKSNFGTGTTQSQGDFNGDAKVDLADFLVLKDNFGKSAGAAAVPEPGALVLLLTGLAAAVILRFGRQVKLR